MKQENSSASWKDILQLVLFVIGFLGSVVASVSQIQGWVQETQTLRGFSIALFILFFVTTLWFVRGAQVNYKWTRLWGGLALLYIVSGGFFVWIGTWIQPEAPTCSDYSIHITSPLNGTHVQGGAVDVQGTYQGDLSNDRIVIIVSLPDGTQNWLSLAPVQIDPILDRWKGIAYLGGDPPQTYHISVALVGKSGRALLMYFAKVGRDTGQWPSIEVLPEDIQVCDYVLVEK
jgi:hypothetical protein